MSVSAISADANGNGNQTPLLAPAPSQESESRSGLPDSFESLKKKRGVKPGSKRGHYNKGPQHSPSPAVVAPPADLFTPENVRALVSLPFNLAFIKTGFEGFTLSEGEAATLGATGSVALNQWVTIDPKYVALMLFSMSLISISSQKMLLFSQAKAEAEKKLLEGNNGQAA